MKQHVGIAGVAVLAALCLTGTSWAAWRVVGRAVNLFTVKGYRTRIEEEYEDPGAVYPSQTVSKVVHVKNEGDTDACIRAKVDVAFGTLDEEGVFVRDDSIDPGAVIIHYDETGLWRRMEDGYFYYTEVLAAGESTKVPLMDSYTLSPDASDKCRGKEGRIFVLMESIQAAPEAVATWTSHSEDLSYAYATALDSQKPVTVLFRGPKDGFSFQGESTDIFASFRNLTPGCTRTQRVKVQNLSEYSTQIFLSAEAVEGQGLTEMERELIQKLLQEYVAIVIQDKNGVLYEGPADGNLHPDKGEMTMSKPIGLGSYYPGLERNLVVSLAVSPQMDTKYQSVIAKVRWVFSASGGNGEYPYTGDESPVGLYLAMALGGILVALTLLVFWRRTRGKGEEE